MLSRLIRSYESEDGVIVSQTEQTYDSKGRDESYSYDGDGLSYGYEYGYNDKDRLGTTRQYYNGRNENSEVIAYGYFGRVRFRIYAGDYNGRISYSYQSYADDANRLTSNMTSMRYTFNGILTFADYTYDNIGNIKSSKYTYDDKVYSEVAYVYDDHNRLIAENCTNSNIGITPYMSSYSYDSFGNITATERPNSAGVTVKNTYSYENSSWRDLLTAYNGHTITYDKIGNPLSYYNGRSYTLRWEMGRQLLSSRVNSRTVYYDYNKDGIRIKKNVSGRYTDRYILDGSKVIGMERTKSGSSVKDVYHFIYDEMGNIWEAVCYIGGSTTPVRYFYRTNAQGDVKQIVDSNYNVVAYYAYDAWGKLLAVLDGNDNPITDSSHFAIVNPFRYRSYVYDTETGFYYLQSRYYDPEIGRFINADGYVTTDIEPVAANMFAYCNNNPVNRDDYSGEGSRQLLSFANWLYAGVAALIALMIPETVKVPTTSLPKSPAEFLPQLKHNVRAKKDSKAKELAPVRTKDLPNDTIVYRYHSSKTENLSPRPKIDYDGLSFSTKPPRIGVSAVFTTIEEINATGILTAIADGGSHVVVIPTNGTVQQWMDQGDNSLWTKVLSSLVIEWDVAG